jgi:hypothetical protein
MDGFASNSLLFRYKEMNPITDAMANAIVGATATAFYKKEEVASFYEVYLELKDNYVMPAPFPQHFPSCYMDGKLISEEFEKHETDEFTLFNVIIRYKEQQLEGDFCIKKSLSRMNVYEFELVGALTIAE